MLFRSVLVRDGVIVAVGESLVVDGPAPAEVVDAAGRVLMPGFVDAHTHACWAGDRLTEFEQRTRGLPYREILASGGGTMATVRAVREATRKQLAANLKTQLDLLLRQGTTTVEVKSCYGLTLEHELKQLHAIQRAANEWSGTVTPTALLGHAIEGDEEAFTREVVREVLPAVWHEFPGIAIDAYAERGAWTVEACVRLFERARKHGLPIRAHTDQFSSLGLIPEALRLHAARRELHVAGREDGGVADIPAHPLDRQVADGVRGHDIDLVLDRARVAAMAQIGRAHV